jgi:xylulokinase
VAYAVRHVMESTIEQGTQVYDVRVFGGQARAALWNRSKADVTNRPVLVPAITEAAALGAAIVAAAGGGSYASIWEGAERMVRIVSRIDPDPRAAEVYDTAFAIYRALYPRLRDLLPALQRLAPLPAV